MILKKYMIVVLALVALVLIVGCGTDSGEVQVVEKGSGSDKIMFGYLGPLTGDVSFIGQQNKAAVELAVEEINNAGGINGKMIHVVYEDGRCSAKDAASAGSKLISINRVDYIIGGACSGETLAVAPLAEANKVIMMSPVSSSPDVTYAGDYIFRDYVNDNDAGRIVAEKMYEAGHKEVALLFSLNDWAQAISEVFKKEFEALGGTVTFEESFVQGSKDLQSVVTKVKSSGADGVAFFEYTQGAVAFFKQKEELGLDVPVYGADTLNDPEIAEGAGVGFDGTKYVILKDAYSDEFKAKIAAKTGESDVKIGTANSYDAVKILAKAISEVGDDTTKVKEWLYNMPLYDGESGSVAFDENGDLADAEFSLWEVQNGESVVIG